MALDVAIDDSRLLRTAAFYGVPFVCARNVLLSALMVAANDGESAGLIKPAGVSGTQHARQAAGRDGQGVAADTKQDNNIS